MTRHLFDLPRTSRLCFFKNEEAHEAVKGNDRFASEGFPIAIDELKLMNSKLMNSKVAFARYNYGGKEEMFNHRGKECPIY